MENSPDYSLKAEFHSVEFSAWTGNLLFTCENIAFNLNRMLRVTNALLSVKFGPLEKFY